MEDFQNWGLAPFDRRKTGRRESDRILFQRDRELEAARKISEALFQHRDVDALVEAALRTALDEVGAEAGSVLLAEPDSRQLVFRYSVGESIVPKGTSIPWDQGIAGKVFQTGVASMFSDVKQCSDHFPGIDQAVGFVTRDMITLPLKQWKGDPIGVMNVLNKREGTLGKHDLDLLTILCAFTALTIQQARLFEEAKLAEVVRLMGNICHDIKNFLQPIVSGVWMIRDEIDSLKDEHSRATCVKYLAMIERTSERIDGRTKEIVDCIKGVSAPLRLAPCRIIEVVNEVFAILSVLAAEKQLSLATKDLDHLPAIQADEKRLYHAFYNLVNNAIPEVRPGGAITISGRVDAGGLLVSVADTGKGMTPDVRESLFTRAVMSTKRGGSGIGMKIIKDAVDAHHGRISVESEVGTGSAFHIWLPYDPCPADARS
jgi:signal transduction histidine kinase